MNNSRARGWQRGAAASPVSPAMLRGGLFSHPGSLSTMLGIVWQLKVVMFGVRMCSQQMYYTCLKIAVISYKPLANVLSIYSYSDRFDLIYLGWG